MLACQGRAVNGLAGTRLEASQAHLRVELAGERRQRGTAGPEHTVALDLSLRL